jgi:DNA-binding IclR family transcriptional regulator
MKPNNSLRTRNLHTRRMRTIARAILENPDLTKKQISRITDLPYSQVRSALPGLEAHGILLSEDEQSRIYPFKPYDPDDIPDD